MRRLAACALLVLAACGSERAPSAPPPPSSAAAAPPPPEPTARERLERHVHALVALGGRAAGTPDELRAAAYGARELAAAGVEPAGTDVLEGGRWAMPVAWGRGSRNVVGRVRGAGRKPGSIVIGAHMDHLGVVGGKVHPGADDNASGVAAVIEAARALVARRGELERDVLVVLFGAEEVGLVGSRAFVRARAADEKVAAMINVDMLGRPLLDQPAAALFRWTLGTSPVGVLGTRGQPALREAVEGACRVVGHRAVAPEDLPAALQPIVEEQARARSDDWPFREAGIPTLFLSSSLSYDYHQPTDTPDKLDWELLEERTQLLGELLLRVARLALAGQPPP